MLGEGARERFVRANGLVHHVIEWGDPAADETVLMCHGFLDFGFCFVTIAPQLAKTRRVIAFDFRGHGETEWVGAGGYYHFTDYVLDLHELVPQLCTGKVHLVGHSMGGSACVLYAGTHPERIATLSLLEGLGPPAEPPELAPERVKTWLKGIDNVRSQQPGVLRDLRHAGTRLEARDARLSPELVQFLSAKATRPHPGGTGLVWRFDPLHRTRAPVPFDRERFVQFTALIEARTLLVYGEHGMRAGDDAERAASLPNARSVTLPGAGHMMQWSHPDGVVALLAAHFSGA